MINRRRLLSTAYLGYDVMRATIAPVGIGVRMMLVRDNSVLLVYHSYVSRWFFPGGSMKRNETPAETAVREVAEEAGAIVTGPVELLGIYTSNHKRRSDHIAMFVVHDFELQPPTDRWEIIGRAFFDLDALPPDFGRGFREVIADYKRGGGPYVRAW